MKKLIPFAAVCLLVAACAPSAKADAQTAGDVAELQAEFTRPIYRNPTEAELTVFVPEKPDAPRTASVSVVSTDDAEVWKGTFPLSPGRNRCVLTGLGTLAPGRYLAAITMGESKLKRMLRVERIPTAARPEGPIRLRKIFFTPDDWLFTSFRNLEVRYSEPKFTQAYHSARPEVVLIDGVSLRQAVDGSYLMQGNEHIYRRGYLYSEEAHRFTVQGPAPEGPYALVDKMPQTRPHKDVFTSFDFLGWAPGRQPYEMYDAARHGTYGLRDIGFVQNGAPYDFGCVKAGARTYWVVARTSSGKTVFLRDTPVFRDVPLYTGDDFDDGFMTNDNFGNSWLADDGKTLFLARGQTVRRFAPYDVPYDLLPNSSRILTLYSTTDGIHWKYLHSISASGAIDDPFAQQYGGEIRFMPDAGLYLAFVNAYDGATQQIYLDLKYSRDGVHFYDFTDPKPFAKATDPRDWTFGELIPDGGITQVGDRYYHLVTGTSLPHYFAEPLFRHSRQSEITADDFKAIFGKRRFEEGLPYFKSLGGWEGIAKHAREGRYAIGTMSYRADGWFGVRAGDREGEFVTRPIAGGGQLSVNARVAPDGLLRVELLDANDRVLDTATIHGDSTESPVFAMPPGDFRLRVTLRSADLYTMYIKP